MHGVDDEKVEGRMQDSFRSRSCLGSCTNPPPIIAVDEPSKGLRVQGQPVNRLGIAEDFWSSSSEVDNSAIQSQRSVSSMSTSNLLSDPQSSAGITSNPIEFVNHGPILWNQTRQQWIGNKRPQKPTQERKISLKATYESLLGTDEPLPQPIPLPEMVKFLVDTWKKEGLYD